jgi:hypothetical protein
VLKVEQAARIVASETTGAEDVVDKLTHRAPIKAIAARRLIADSIIEAGRYNL